MPLIPELGRLSQLDLSELKASLIYIVKTLSKRTCFITVCVCTSCVRVNRGTYMPWCTCKSQRATYWSLFAPLPRLTCPPLVILSQLLTMQSQLASDSQAYCLTLQSAGIPGTYPTSSFPLDECFAHSRH